MAMPAVEVTAPPRRSRRGRWLAAPIIAGLGVVFVADWRAAVEGAVGSGRAVVPAGRRGPGCAGHCSCGESGTGAWHVGVCAGGVGQLLGIMLVGTGRVPRQRCVQPFLLRAGRCPSGPGQCPAGPGTRPMCCSRWITGRTEHRTGRPTTSGIQAAGSGTGCRCGPVQTGHRCRVIPRSCMPQLSGTVPGRCSRRATPALTPRRSSALTQPAALPTPHRRPGLNPGCRRCPVRVMASDDEGCDLRSEM